MNVSENKLRSLLEEAYELGIVYGWQSSTVSDNFQRGTGTIRQETILEDHQESIDRQIDYEIKKLKGSESLSVFSVSFNVRAEDEDSLRRWIHQNENTASVKIKEF